MIADSREAISAGKTIPHGEVKKRLAARALSRTCKAYGFWYIRS